MYINTSFNLNGIKSNYFILSIFLNYLKYIKINGIIKIFIRIKGEVITTVLEFFKTMVRPEDYTLYYTKSQKQFI